jgi:putative Mn2+ efflux pump MntP
VNIASVLLLSVGLAMDATAVAAARGLATPVITARHVALVAGFFGGFQALMPFIGWYVGDQVGPWVQAWDHWIAFVLLAAIGGKMLWEARGEADDDDAPDPATGDLFGFKIMLLLAIATSIDALAAGFTLTMLDVPVAVSLAIIGLTTAVLSALGLFAGRRFGAHLGARLDALGGVVLIGLGGKILYEHLTAAA